MRAVSRLALACLTAVLARVCGSAVPATAKDFPIPFVCE